jgi:hypothetical protein
MRVGAARALGVSPDEIDMTNMEAFVVQDGAYLDAGRDAVLEHHTSFEEYARTAPNCSGDLLDSLRGQLVDLSA